MSSCIGKRCRAVASYAVAYKNVRAKVQPLREERDARVGAYAAARRFRRICSKSRSAARQLPVGVDAISEEAPDAEQFEVAKAWFVGDLGNKVRSIVEAIVRG